MVDKLKGIGIIEMRVGSLYILIVFGVSYHVGAFSVIFLRNHLRE